MTNYYLPATGEALQHDQLALRFPETSIPASALGALDAGSLEMLGLVPLTIDPAPDAVFGWSAVPAPVELRDGAYRQGWRLVAWPPEQVADALRRRRRAVLDAVDARAGALLAAGFGFDFGGQDGVLHLQLRGLDDQTSWLVLRSSASELIEAGQGGTLLPMRTAENVTVYRPATVIRQVLQAMTAYGLKVRGAAWALKDQVDASAEPEKIDITAGWPV